MGSSGTKAESEAEAKVPLFGLRKPSPVNRSRSKTASQPNARKSLTQRLHDKQRKSLPNVSSSPIKLRQSPTFIKSNTRYRGNTSQGGAQKGRPVRKYSKSTLLNTKAEKGKALNRAIARSKQAFDRYCPYCKETIIFNNRNSWHKHKSACQKRLIANTKLNLKVHSSQTPDLPSPSSASTVTKNRDLGIKSVSRSRLQPRRVTKSCTGVGEDLPFDAPRKSSIRDLGLGCRETPLKASSRLRLKPSGS